MQLSRQPSNKRSVPRRVLSSSKFQRAVTTRQGSQASVSNRQQISKLASVRQKQKKINNFFDNLTNVFGQKVERTSKRKHHTTKAHLKNKYEQFLLKKSDKTKVLYWNNDPFLNTMPKIIISADFIFNQDDFWEANSKNNEEKGQQTVRSSQKVDLTQQTLIREWKYLHKNYFVVWLIRRKSSWSKLQQLVSNFGLAIHSVCYVKKKRNYTVDLSPVYQEIQKVKPKSTPLAQSMANSSESQYSEDKIIVFQIFKLNIKDIANYSSFQSRIPVLLGVNAKVILLRIQNLPPGLQSVIKYLLKCRGESVIEGETQLRVKQGKKRYLQIYLLSSIPNYLRQYLVKLKRQQLQYSIFGSKQQQDFEYEEQTITSKIQTMKKKLIDQLIKQQGRGYQFQSGSSIYNFVGEMFKRNYRILEQNMLAGMQAQKRIVRRCQGEWQQGEVELNLNIDYYQMCLN